MLKQSVSTTECCFLAPFSIRQAAQSPPEFRIVLEDVDSQNSWGKNCESNPRGIIRVLKEDGP